MLGAIYGDKAGSIYEFEQIKKIHAINPQKLIVDNSFYSDDTIETIAVIDAIINKIIQIIYTCLFFDFSVILSP